MGILTLLDPLEFAPRGGRDQAHIQNLPEGGAGEGRDEPNLYQQGGLGLPP